MKRDLKTTILTLTLSLGITATPSFASEMFPKILSDPNYTKERAGQNQCISKEDVIKFNISWHKNGYQANYGNERQLAELLVKLHGCAPLFLEQIGGLENEYTDGEMYLISALEQKSNGTYKTIFDDVDSDNIGGINLTSNTNYIQH